MYFYLFSARLLVIVVYTCIIGCGTCSRSTLYIGIAIVFVFSPYIWKCFQFRVIWTPIHLKTKLYATFALKYHFWSKLSFPMFFFFWLKTCNSITVVSIHMKLCVWIGFYNCQGVIHKFYLNSFTTRVPISIGPTHTLLNKLRIGEGQTYLRIPPSLRVLILICHCCMIDCT